MGYFGCFGVRKKGKELKVKDEEVRSVEDNRKPAGNFPASSSGEFVLINMQTNFLMGYVDMVRWYLAFDFLMGFLKFTTFIFFRFLFTYFPILCIFVGLFIIKGDD